MRKQGILAAAPGSQRHTAAMSTSPQHLPLAEWIGMSLDRFARITSRQASAEIESLRPGRRDRPTSVTIVKWRVHADERGVAEFDQGSLPMAKLA